MEFLAEPWGPIALCGIIASTLWLCIWMYLRMRGRFRRAAFGGVPALVGGLVVCAPFGAVVLVAGSVLTALLSIFWMIAVTTGTFERERAALASAMDLNAESEDSIR